LVLVIASPAFAQLSGNIAVRSDDRFRGRSVSQGRPTMALDLSYDHKSGIFLDVVVKGVATREYGPKFLSVQENLGYAHQIGPRLSFDLGVTNSDYTKYYNDLRSVNYQDYYVGLTKGAISAHIHYSPRYFGLPLDVVYGEADGAIRLKKNWRLTGHVGVLQQVSGRTLGSSGRTHYDYRIGTVVTCGPVDLVLEWTGGGPGKEYYNDDYHSRDRVVAGATLNF
jgi:uncharacterized protein (TIGR02001 family)